jgi:hypothetical protein
MFSGNDLWSYYENPFVSRYQFNLEIKQKVQSKLCGFELFVNPQIMIIIIEVIKAKFEVIQAEQTDLLFTSSYLFVRFYMFRKKMDDIKENR